jgi:hypothetical protein
MQAVVAVLASYAMRMQMGRQARQKRKSQGWAAASRAAGGGQDLLDQDVTPDQPAAEKQPTCRGGSLQKTYK